MTAKPKKPLFYGDEGMRLIIAQWLYERFCSQLYDNPNQAKTLLIAGIQVALRTAHEQGRNYEE